jgi:NAD(P)-dependent dehydrogenase (short-subunit alcohol dehydrogenase family)
MSSDLIKDLFSLESKVALVTGGSGDIGLAIARGLALAGAHLALNGISQTRLSKAQEDLSGIPVTIRVFPMDVSDPRFASTLVQDVSESMGGLDILVNCVGVNRRKPILDTPPEDYEFIMNANLRSAYFVSQAAARQMIERGGGKILNIGSLTSVMGLSDVSVYGMSKAALVQLTKTMAVEWAPYNIRVNCLAPGFFVTRMTRESLWSDPQKSKWMLDRIPVGRPGYPTDLVGAVLLLASTAGDYITGQTLWVDGGVLAGSHW